MKGIIRLFILLAIFTWNTSAIADITLEPSGGDDTASFIEAFNKITEKYDLISIKSGTYTITESMPEIPYPVNIIGEGSPVINLVNVNRFLTISQRDTTVANLRIVGENSHLSSGILVKGTSWATLKNITFIDLKTGLEFQYAHDFRALDSLAFYHNDTDFSVNILDASHKPSTSFSFTNCKMEKSQQAISINTDVTNFSFTNCGFAPETTSEKHPVFIHGAVFKGVFRNNRFENSNSSLNVEAIYIKGVDNNYPAQSIHLQDNYFTGHTVSNHIFIDKYIENLIIDNNHFQTTPTECDIRYQDNYPVVQHNNHVLTNLRRDLKIGNSSTICQ